MLKYVDTKIVFQEIPNEITLAINISNCKCNCKGCHSSYLKEDIGTVLNLEVLEDLINKNKGITCVAFMGGDSEPIYVDACAKYTKIVNKDLKTAWYSGRESLHSHIDLAHFDFIKLGPYIAELGPLTSKNTNQRLYKIENGNLIDITNKFWK
jgi:anaerobic ribonucleoside-triphosphate reductase activating protein